MKVKSKVSDKVSERRIAVINRTGLKLGPQLLMMVAMPMLILFIFSFLCIRAVSQDTSARIIQHELKAAEYAFEVSVNNFATGNFMYTNEKFYKGRKNISDDMSFFDNFSHEVDLQVTVFYGDTRVATSLVDENGNRIVGTKADPAIYEQVVGRGEEYYSESVMIVGKEYYAMYGPLYQANSDEIIGMVFVGFDKAIMNEIYNDTMVANLIFLGVIFALGLVMVSVFVSLMVKLIKRVTNYLNQLAQGELNVVVDKKALKRADEIGDIANAINSLINNLTGIVKSIFEVSGKLDSISTNFAGSFDAMAENISNINIAVEEMANSSTVQAQDTSEVGSEVSQMGDAIDSTSGNIENLVGNTDKMREYNRSVEKTLRELIEISNDTKKAFDVVYEQTNMTNISAKDIQAAADVITDIADQTNLLSLNASIEAARAGEHGRGFAVVADEIRGLAEQSADSASRITTIIEALIKNSNTTVDTMKKVTEILDKQGQELEATKVVFGDLNSEIGEVGNAVDNIKSEISVLNSLKENALSAVQSLAAISEENAATTQETAASMNEMQHIVSESGKEVSQIVDMSKELEENIKIFKL